MFKYKTRHKILTVLVLSIFASTATNGADRVTGEVFAMRSPVLATSAMVATSQPLATQVTLDAMKNGGNAIDTAIAANALIGYGHAAGY